MTKLDMEFQRIQKMYVGTLFVLTTTSQILRQADISFLPPIYNDILCYKQHNILIMTCPCMHKNFPRRC